MELHLPFPPTPDHMADHAAFLVQVVRRIDGIDLDFSAASLLTVDTLLGRFHNNGDDPEVMAETLFQFGAYIGQVIVQQANGSWTTVPENHPMSGGWPLVALTSGSIVNPIAKAFKRVRNGEGDSIAYFYSALVEN